MRLAEIAYTVLIGAVVLTMQFLVEQLTGKVTEESVAGLHRRGYLFDEGSERCHSIFLKHRRQGRDVHEEVGFKDYHLGICHAVFLTRMHKIELCASRQERSEIRIVVLKILIVSPIANSQFWHVAIVSPSVYDGVIPTVNDDAQAVGRGFFPSSVHVATWQSRCEILGNSEFWVQKMKQSRDALEVIEKTLLQSLVIKFIEMAYSLPGIAYSLHQFG